MLTYLLSIYRWLVVCVRKCVSLFSLFCRKADYGNNHYIEYCKLEVFNQKSHISKSLFFKFRPNQLNETLILAKNHIIFKDLNNYLLW